MFIDDLVGHFSPGVYVHIILYADDILLIAPSVCELQRLFSACESELIQLDMSINVKKSCCIRIGPRHDAVCASISTQCGNNLPWVNELRYLGVYFVSSRTFKCSLDFAKRACYRSLNAIFGKVGRVASEEVIIELVNKKCLPILLYGLEALPLNNSDKKSLDFVFTRFFMKLFKTANITVVKECQLYLGFRLPSDVIVSRSNRFIKKYCESVNSVCAWCSHYIS